MVNNPLDDSRKLEDMQLFDKEILECPYHYNKELREQAPVYKDPETGIYIISKYELVKEAARKKDIFSSQFILNADSSEAEEVKEIVNESWIVGQF